LPTYVNIQILPLLKGKIDWQGVDCDSSIIWLAASEAANPWVAQD